jgi:hypothetical protein
MLDQNCVPCQCRDHEPSGFDRPATFLPLILVMLASSILLFTSAGLSYLIQFASLIPYTSLVLLSTFSAQRGQQPYFFECPVVSRTLPRLAWRHCGFLAGLVIFETLAVLLRPNLPASWLVAKGKDGSPFAMGLFAFGACLAFTQALSNRSILERAHRLLQKPGPPAAEE